MLKQNLMKLQELTSKSRIHQLNLKSNKEKVILSNFKILSIKHKLHFNTKFHNLMDNYIHNRLVFRV